MFAKFKFKNTLVNVLSYAVFAILLALNTTVDPKQQSNKEGMKTIDGVALDLRQLRRKSAQDLRTSRTYWAPNRLTSTSTTHLLTETS